MSPLRHSALLAACAALAVAATGCSSSKSSSRTPSTASTSPTVTITSPAAGKPGRRRPQPVKRAHQAPKPLERHPAKTPIHAHPAKHSATGGAAITGVSNRTKARLRAVMGNGP